jgi:hypothetical protein
MNVYLILDEAKNAVKIGKANDVEQRLSDLQIGNATELVVLSVIPCISEKHSKDIEIDLHHEYSEYHLRGEWFRYDESVFKELIQSGIQFTPKKTREPLIVSRNTLFGEEEVFNSDKAPQCYFYTKLKAQSLGKFEKIANLTISWRTMSYPTEGKQELLPFSEDYDRVFISDRKHKENLALSTHNKKKSTKIHLANQEINLKVTLDNFIG